MSVETEEQTERRLRGVISEADVTMHEGVWCFEESLAPPVLTTDVLAVVRDDQVWSRLVPARADYTGERFGIFSFHFPGSPDNSGFIGWLAGHLKRELGTGVFVVCGNNTARGGIFDYWGCPVDVLPRALRLVEGLRS